jgi:hypothetical protein
MTKDKKKFEKLSENLFNNVNQVFSLQLTEEKKIQTLTNFESYMENDFEKFPLFISLCFLNKEINMDIHFDKQKQEFYMEIIFSNYRLSSEKMKNLSFMQKCLDSINNLF